MDPNFVTQDIAGLSTRFLGFSLPCWPLPSR
jgi:hypothetical protein